MTAAKLGQHFLVNRNVAEKIVRNFLPVQGGILEIGPGTGILTDLLFKYREEKENKIYAVEVDRELYYKLKTKYRENFEIIERNVLTITLENICSTGKMNLISNIPYYISREIIDWVIAGYENISKGIFMMQREFVDKLILPGSTTRSNAQAVMFNYLFDIRKLFPVNPGSFSPAPKIKSTVFLFEKKADEGGKEIAIGHFYLFLKDCFKNRRKTLFNNLQEKFPAERCWEIFEKTKLNPGIRAEELTLTDFLNIYRSTERQTE